MSVANSHEQEPRPLLPFSEDLTRQREQLTEIATGLMDPKYKECSMLEYMTIADELKSQRSQQNINNNSYMADFSFSKVLADTRRVKLLNIEEETSLFFLIKSGHEVLEDDNTNIDDKEQITTVLSWAREEAILANLRLVAYVVNRKPVSSFTPAVDIDDHFNYGVMGLMRSIDKFDWTKGFKFSTYAILWIQQAVQRGSTNDGPLIRLPHTKDTINKNVGIEMNNLATGKINKGNVSTEEWLSVQMGMSLGKATEALLIYAQQKPADSLDKPYGSTDESPDSNLYDIVSSEYDSSESNLDQISDICRLNELLSILTEREAYIIKLRWGIGAEGPKTLNEVGQIIGTSRERVRQIQDEAFKKIKRFASKNSKKRQ